MKQPSLLDRRRFLLGAAPAVTIAALGVSACSNSNRHADLSTYSPTYFSAAEWVFINAAVCRLIPAEGAGPGGVHAGVPEFIDRQMELPYGHGDQAPGVGENEHSDSMAMYTAGLGFALLLTGASFMVSQTNLLWPPGVPAGLAVLAIAQMGVHLVFFLQIGTGPDNTNNVLALAFGLLVVTLVVTGSLWIMAHLNTNMMPASAIMEMQR